jgi:hypothetical protein
VLVILAALVVVVVQAVVLVETVAELASMVIFLPLVVHPVYMVVERGIKTHL